jgi:hypothetical protein
VLRWDIVNYQRVYIFVNKTARELILLGNEWPIKIHINCPVSACV